MNDVTTTILSVVIAALVLGAIYLLVHFSNKKTVLPAVKQIADALPTVFNLIQSLALKGDSESAAFKTLEVLKGIAQSVVSSVEQVSINQGDLSSEEKLNLAKEQFWAICKTVGVDPSELDENVVISLIENAVFQLDK
jgi:Bacteriophage holin of superfamily 6 (Holin_LLH)